MKPIKILLTHSNKKEAARVSIDIWRMVRPFAELAKHTDYQIDHQSYLIDEELINAETNKVNTPELINELIRIGQYDIVWTGYFPDAVLFDCIHFVQEKFGTKFVLDVDDDFFDIPASNPIWKQKGDMKRNINEVQYATTEVPYLVTSTKALQKSYGDRRNGKPTYVLPNYIGSDYTHKPFDNGNDVVITYAGGISHYKDLEKSGFLPALKRLMKDYRNVRAGSVGIELKAMTGTLKKRYTFVPGLSGQLWLDELFPKINADIMVAPLEDYSFNRAKTNIKWLESAMIPAAFVGTNIPPYKGSVTDGVDGLLVDNSEENWYNVLEKLVLNKELRVQLAENAHDVVKKNWFIDTKWQTLDKIIKDICSA